MELKLPPFSSLHHAHALVGDLGVGEASLEAYLSEQGIVIQGNPDVVVEKHDTWLIEHSRMVKAQQAQKPNGTYKIFIIIFSHMQHEAQHSLLKVFEEPTPYTYFFLLMPHRERLLPTLLSRLNLIALDKKEGVLQNKIDTAAFLKMKAHDRIALVYKVTDPKLPDEEKMTKHEALLFLNELEVLLVKNKDYKTRNDIFEGIRKTRSYLGDTGSTVKLLLEYISLLV